MALPNREYEGGSKSYTENTEEFGDMIQSYGNCVEEFGGAPHSRANAYIGRTFESFDTNISVRSDYNRADYDYFRKSETVPVKSQEVMQMCMKAYKKVGIVRSVIDMMADFTVAGIRIVHPNQKIESFYRNWAKTVMFDMVSERIAHMLYLGGNCPVKIRWGKVNVAVEREFRKTHGDDDVKIKPLKTDKRRIPLGYNILNPLSIEIIGGELSAFVGNPIYALKISHHTRNMIEKMRRLSIKNDDIHEMLSYIPDDMKAAVQAGKKVYPLDQSKIEMLHYKKYDWEVWASPMLESILSNLILLEKMHLADSSALDGAISQIRLWKLGIYNQSNPQHSVLPNRAAVAKLRNILAQVGTGVLDLVWGPELDFKESNSQVHNYLKGEKYNQVMEEIFQGLGVPATLSGSKSGGNSGFTNNAISMKTMVERLEYGRKTLTHFWEKQFKLIQKAMGFRAPAKLAFDYKVLSDEASEKAILMDLFDRNVIAAETMQELCRRDPKLEEIRIKREQAKMASGKIPDKAGPYHNAEKDHDLRKIILQAGGVTPSEVGLELEERKEGEETKNEQMERMQKDAQQMQMKQQEQKNKENVSKQKSKPTSPGGDGRPKNSNDKKQRKQKEVKPKTQLNAEFLATMTWALEAQKELDSMLKASFLEHYDKKSLRSLTKDEVKACETVKFRVLAALKPFEDIEPENVYNILVSENKIDEKTLANFTALSLIYVNKNGKEPSIDELRQMQASSYALTYEEEINV